MDEITVRGTKILSSNGHFVIRAGELFDGRDIYHNVDIEVKDGRIARVFQDRANIDCPILDFSNQFVMPGLIEAHVHLSGMHTQEPYRRYFENNDLRLIRALRHAEELLAHGYTTIREMGAKGRGIGIRQGIEKGVCNGPRILTSIEFLSPTGGHGDWPIFPYDFVKEKSLRSILVDGPEECVKAIRYLLREGADVLKIVTATGSFGQPYDNMRFRPCFSLQEILSMSEEAHAQGKKIAAHVVGDIGLRNALDGNIDTLEHCFFNFNQHPELLDEIVKRHVYLVPTLSIIKWFGEYEEQNGNVHAADNFYYNLERHGEFVKAAWNAGVPIACGTDENGMHGQGRCPEEYVLLTKAGIPEIDVLRSATNVASEVLGIADIGTIATGKIADVLVLEKSPIDNISVLTDKQNITCVFQG